MAKTRQLATFVLDGLFFGVEVQRVQEVIRYQAMTRVPLAPDVVSGVINLRGQIVMAIDGRRRLGLRDRPAGTLPMNIVLRTDDGAVSLLVDEIGDVLEVAEACVERPLETLRGPVRELVQAICKLDGQLLLILDTEKTVRIGGADDRASDTAA